MPDLDVFLQDQAAAEGAFSLCAIPKGESGRGGLQRHSPKTKARGLSRGRPQPSVHSDLRGRWEGTLGNQGWGHPAGQKRGRGPGGKGYLHG